MALYTFKHDAEAVTAAGRRWVRECLVGDGSVFSDAPLATPGNFDVLDAVFVQKPDEGDRKFYEKLKTQLEGAPPRAIQLMAELLWVLFLFPSNITPNTKREGVLTTWRQSGTPLVPDHPLLSDSILDGIGSGGMGVNTNRWRELNYVIGIGRVFKRMTVEERRATVASYERFMEWMEGVPAQGNRQFRHMLRYFLFPERVERMSTNTHRREVLDGFGVASLADTRHWSDRKLDDALLELRKRLEDDHGTTDIDFYLEPLRSRWKPEVTAQGGGAQSTEFATERDYRDALAAAKLDASQMAWLLAHAVLLNGQSTMRQLSHAVGHADWQTANLLYGTIAGRLAKKLRRRPRHLADVREPQHMAWIAIHLGKGGDGESVWEMVPALRDVLIAPRFGGDEASGVDDVIEGFLSRIDQTERVAEVRQRIGQDIFRAQLLQWWGGCCAVTGLDVVELLRASHAMPWGKCEQNEQRLDTFNGLLLCAHLDALFDRGFITFDDDGAMRVSPQLPGTAMSILGLSAEARLRKVHMRHAPYLAYHRSNVFKV